MPFADKEDVINFLDLLDLDEEVIDRRLKTLMVRKTLSRKQLSNFVHLVEYKLLINTQEDTECDNDEELNFVANLLTDVSDENIDYVCNITNAVLRLNPSSLTSKAEHMLQQILTELQMVMENENNVEKMALLKLKVCDSILDAVLQSNKKLCIIFEAAIENFLNPSDDKLKSHFLMNTVPRLFNVTVPCVYGRASNGMNILDCIWGYIQKLTEEKTNLALKVLVTLSEFYLPTADNDGKVKYESQIIFSKKFWQTILFGMNTSDVASRKIAIYLAKRAVECFVNIKRNVRIISDDGLLLFQWVVSKGIEQKLMWDNFFILIESLEEKQSNIVLPSLHLFETVQSLGACWLNIAYNMGLSHSNLEVKQECIEHKLKARITNIPEAKSLLEALNDINLYANPANINKISANINKVFQEDAIATTQIFKAFPLVNWSSVPLHYTTKVLTNNSDVQSHVKAFLSSGDAVGTICDILKISCNNVLIRKKMHTELLILLTKCSTLVTIEQFTHIVSLLETDFENGDYYKIIAQWLMNTENDKRMDILKCISEKYCNLDVVLAMRNAEEPFIDFIHEVTKKMHDISNVVNRQYCDKLECFHTAAFLIRLYNQTEGSEHKCIRDFIEANLNTLTRYILELVLSENVPSEDEIKFLDNNLGPIFETASIYEDLKQTRHQINKICLTVLKDWNAELVRKIFCMTVLKLSLNAYPGENIQLRELLDVMKCTEIKTNEKGKDVHSRVLNKFYQALCELVHFLISKKINGVLNIEDEMLPFIDNALECGGYGCLQWIIKLMREILPQIIVKAENYDLKKFIDRIWNEIEEVKANQQYMICIEEFINILFDLMIDVKKRDNAIYAVIVHYCRQIIKMGEISLKPLLILARKMANTPMTAEVGAVYILDEILLFSPVLRKDQRITNAATLEIISALPNWESHVHDFDSPRLIAVSALLNVTDKNILKTVFERMMAKVELLFKNKQRYHGNSQHHRVLLSFLQHTLLIILLQPEIVGRHEVRWCVDMLRKIPHQPSVKACLEWIVALYFCLKKLDLNEFNMEQLELRRIPQLSQFMIPFLVLKHRMKYGEYKMEEYTFVMEYLLSYTMGQQYSVRLHAQYLASQLHLKKTNTYDYVMKLIERNFRESETEKNYVRLKEDFLLHRFDIIHFLTPKYIYHIVPTELGDEPSYVLTFSLPEATECEAYIKRNKVESEVTKTWFCRPKNDDDMALPFKLCNKSTKDRGDSINEAVGTIQKKYIPWRKMTDIDGFKEKRKTENTSGLIVVASLVDKLPNLGGLARTGEVFGVQTYVIDSLRHLQDRQFQGLSLSAERWVNIEEVRPGKPLKEYLLKKKFEGYCIVAAEQTSGSVPLQSFKFPKRTLLLLGHEKEGVPCDLLLLTDSFVEIPQQGYVRSLNVHVTAAIFVWEYTRQHVLGQ